MRILYSIGITIYRLGVILASLWNEKARQMLRGWNTIEQQISDFDRRIEKASRTDAPRAWFHASSLGEFEQARPVLEQFKQQHPSHLIILTFFSPSGYEVRKNYEGADLVCYLPMDTPSNARRWFKTIHPDIVFFVKYDFWFNYLNECRTHSIPTFIFSTIFRKNQYFFQPFGKWFCRQLNCFTHLFVQNQESLQLLQQHGISQCSIAGDTRFDRVFQIAQKAPRYPEIETFIGSCPTVMVAGSTWEPDELNIKSFLDSHLGDLKLILAPHMINESHLQHILTLFGPHNCIRYSQLHEADTANRSILIIDNFGMLSSIYRYGTFSYIGGGFGRGIHNILEALTFGQPVCFGPNYEKFQEAKNILALGGGKSYEKAHELISILTLWMSSPEACQQAAQQSRQYVEDNIGSTERILNLVESHLNR